ncbi:hypothetical protein KKH82_08625 [Patescibacteria group bacterium]|nr:hypothetical protein [Patescibacteria group bacterium]
MEPQDKTLDMEKNEFINKYGVNAFTRLGSEATYEEGGKTWVKSEYFPED